MSNSDKIFIRVMTYLIFGLVIAICVMFLATTIKEMIKL